MVPNGWKRVPIKEVCHSIIDCVNKTAPVVDYETPYKMIRTSNVRNGRVNTFDVRYVTKETYEQWTRRGAPLKGDVILTREAPVGEVGILENAEGIFLGQRLMMYRANKKIADNYYLFYSLSSAFCQKQIEDYSNGGTVAHMRVPDCGEILVNLPPLLEQQKIAQVLSTWDQAISTTEKLLENSQQQKKALMQQLLTGKKRLLDKNGVEFSDEWQRFSLGSVAKVYQPKTISQSELSSDGYPVYGANGIIGYYSDFNHELEQIAVTCRGSTCGVVNWTVPKSWITGNAMVINVDGSVLVDKKFLFYVLGFSDLKYLITGSGQPQITGDIKNHVVSLAPIEEQKNIAHVLTLADQEIDIFQTKIDCLKQEKKALMQQLLTGKKRVKVAA